MPRLETFSCDEQKLIGQQLSTCLNVDETSTRQGPGNIKLVYIESWKVIQSANKIFGFNGWNCSIVSLNVDYCEEKQGKFLVGASAVIRITLRDGTFHEDIGFGSGETTKKGSSMEAAKKEAVSDGRKRALRLFGEAMGNCLYDKNYVKEMKRKGIMTTQIKKEEANEQIQTNTKQNTTTATTLINKQNQTQTMNFQRTVVKPLMQKK